MAVTVSELLCVCVTAVAEESVLKSFPFYLTVILSLPYCCKGCGCVGVGVILVGGDLRPDVIYAMEI